MHETCSDLLRGFLGLVILPRALRSRYWQLKKYRRYSYFLISCSLRTRLKQNACGPSIGVTHLNRLASAGGFVLRHIGRRSPRRTLALAELVIAHTTLYSAAELAIWRKHLVGIDAKSSRDKRSALLAFAAELDQSGFQKPNWFETMLGSR